MSFPRTDLHVSINGLAIKPGLALGSWAAFLGTDDNAMVVGDLVLLEKVPEPLIILGAGIVGMTVKHGWV